MKKKIARFILPLLIATLGSNIIAAPLYQGWYSPEKGLLTYELESGQVLLSEPNDKKTTFLMVNGNISPSGKLPVIDGRAFVPLRVLSNELGMNVQWNANTKSATITKDTDTIVVSTKTNPTEVKNIKGTIYVSVKYLSEKFPLKVNYYTSKIKNEIIIGDAVVSVDNKDIEEIITQDEAAKIVDKTIRDEFERLKNEGEFLKLQPANSDGNKYIQQCIDNTKYIGKQSRYYIFKGQHTLLVDATNEKIYAQKVESFKIWIDEFLENSEAYFILYAYAG